VPDEFLVELKSLKMYIWSYRDEGAFHEAVTNTILDDLVRVLSPRRMTVETVWKVRGGVLTTVTASHP
jgi:7-cyano-7-deazaguanine reductase